jgi:nucleotide-binding universal stress UspA family protein
MRILLAVDGSVSSDHAVSLVTSLQLPAESLVRVIAVQAPYTDGLAMTWAAMGEAGSSLETAEEASVRQHREAVARAEARLLREGLTVEGFLIHGRPGSAIVDEATAIGADLVVVGSRGHGSIATMVLGSTASEVVDHSPCPVLVARTEHLGPVVFADDGSHSARTAEMVFTSWPLFRQEHVTVLTVAELAVPVAAGFTPGMYDQALEVYTRSADDTRRETEQEAMNEAHRLVSAGLAADAVALDGDPAAEILQYAASRGVATIVVGTRGHTGLARLILGSVARNVLQHAGCSVLVVRDRKTKR